jgi:hypothetical protein
MNIILVAQIWSSLGEFSSTGHYQLLVLHLSTNMLIWQNDVGSTNIALDSICGNPEGFIVPLVR